MNTDGGTPACAGLSPALSSCWQRSWRDVTFVGYFEKLCDVDDEGSGDAIEKIDRYIEVAAFNSANCGAIYPGVEGKILLRHLFSGTHFSQIPAKALASIHDRMATILMAVNPSDISNIFQFTREICAAKDKQ